MEFIFIWAAASTWKFLLFLFQHNDDHHGQSRPLFWPCTSLRVFWLISGSQSDTERTRSQGHKHSLRVSWEGWHFTGLCTVYSSQRVLLVRYQISTQMSSRQMTDVKREKGKRQTLQSVDSVPYQLEQAGTCSFFSLQECTYMSVCV